MGAIPRIQDFDDPAYDPFVSDDAAFADHDDPYPHDMPHWRWTTSLRVIVRMRLSVAS